MSRDKKNTFNVHDILPDDIRFLTDRLGSPDKIDAKESAQWVKDSAKDLLKALTCNMHSVVYANVNKLPALRSLNVHHEKPEECAELEEEIRGVCRLIESHAVILRQQILHRCMKTEMREMLLGAPQTFGLKTTGFRFGVAPANIVDDLRSKLAEMPEEWYMIQLTAPYQHPSPESPTNFMHMVHITVLPTGSMGNDPFYITLPKPDSMGGYDVCNEIQMLLSKNRSELGATYTNHELYWKMRDRQNTIMKAAIKELEFTWMREWRVLFMADPINNEELVVDLERMIDKLIADYKYPQNISMRLRWLLKKIALGSCYLSREEIARAVKFVLPDDEKLAGNVILSIYGKLSTVEPLRSAIRKTLVLVVDENMDYLPFESLEILKSHPVTRFPSLHIAYALFKEHESTMQDGCKIIHANSDMGTCIVNPSGTLPKMEKRIKLFIRHWLPQWKSYFNVVPKEEEFEDALVNRDILMYNGHGSGIQYLPGDQIERLKVKAVVLLFGCSSVKLMTVGGRFPPYGISNQYLIASSPCVLGTLWEITDADIDKITANFISSWIPSPDSRPWSEVDTNAWCAGRLRFLEDGNSTQDTRMQPEMLRAVAKSKEACSHFMTEAAIVVRGLPVKIV